MVAGGFEPPGSGHPTPPIFFIARRADAGWSSEFVRPPDGRDFGASRSSD
jgi:hypothetical protein